MTTNEPSYTWDEYVLKLPKMSLSTAPLLDDERYHCKGDCILIPGIYGNYEFQNAMAMRLGGKMLNAACADDPAKLGWLGAINMDFHAIDIGGAKKDFSKSVSNFVQGSVLDMKFADGEFDTVILGEFLEHCKFDVAVRAVEECRRVLKPGGHLVMTFPLDGRSRDEQRGENEWPLEYDEGITCAHQTWWGTQNVRSLRDKVRMVEVMRSALFYMLTAPIGGWGLVWRKP